MASSTRILVLFGLLHGGATLIAASTRRAVPPVSSYRCNSASCSAKDAFSFGNVIRGSAVRFLGSTVLGASTGSAAHAALQQVAPMPVHWIDSLLNALSCLSGTSVGALIGALWATEVAIVGSGVITSAFQQAASVVVDANADELAGTRALQTVRATLTQLRETPGLQGILIGGSLALCGLYDDPVVERLAAEAEAQAESESGTALANQGAADTRPRTFSGLIGLAVESTITARFTDLKLGIVGTSLVLVGVVDALLYALGNILGGM